MRQYFAAAALAASILAAGAASAECKLETVADLPLTMERSRPMVEANINGTPVSFLLDTGAFETILTADGAARLNLKTVASAHRTNYGVDGAFTPRQTTLSKLQLGPFTIRDQTVFVAGEPSQEAPYVGFLGQTVLGLFDIELDLKGGHARLIKAQGCRGDQVAYWGGAYSVAELQPADDDKIDAWVKLNGRATLAELDSGASASVVGMVSARSAAIKLATPIEQSATYGTGLAGKRLPREEAVFNSFSIGDENVRNARLFVSDIFGAATYATTGSRIPKQISDVPDMLLGDDFIKAHRIYISRSQNRMYFSYVGGPIFQTPPPMKASDAPAPPPQAPAKP